MLPGLIDNWRADWGQGQFPFYYVQLALISGRPTWAIIRDAQVSTLDVPNNNTAMACIIDVATMPASEIHPKDKEPVGERLALPARALLYGESGLVYSGPIRQLNPTKAGNTVTIRFTHTEGGLMTDNSPSPPGPFLIAGGNGVYYPTTAQIVGNTVEVSIPSGMVPKSVRYCWGSYPDCNLFNGGVNGNGRLPASPFQLTVP
jgi:sialate O-acetylesterase